jgi:hypothetical protein
VPLRSTGCAFVEPIDPARTQGLKPSITDVFLLVGFAGAFGVDGR